MFGTSSFFFVIVIVLLAVSFWSVFDYRRFTRFDGPIKRGVTVAGEPLTWEMRQFLEMMPPVWRDDRNFIRKEINEVLIAEEQSIWHRFLNRRDSLRYIAYVNLSAPEGRIEFRVPFSGLISMILVFGVVLTIFAEVFWFSIDGPGFSLLPWSFPVLFLAIFIGSVFFNHYRERRRLLGVLNRAMGNRLQSF